MTHRLFSLGGGKGLMSPSLFKTLVSSRYTFTVSACFAQLNLSEQWHLRLSSCEHTERGCELIWIASLLFFFPSLPRCPRLHRCEGCWSTGSLRGDYNNSQTPLHISRLIINFYVFILLTATRFEHKQSCVDGNK